MRSPPPPGRLHMRYHPHTCANTSSSLRLCVRRSFHFGTFYLNPGTVIWYLQRMEPFTSQHIILSVRRHPPPHYRSHAHHRRGLALLLGNVVLDNLVIGWHACVLACACLCVRGALSGWQVRPPQPPVPQHRCGLEW